MSSHVESQKWCCIVLSAAAWISLIVASTSTRPSVKSAALKLASDLGKEAADCFVKLVSENNPTKARQLESVQLIPLRAKVVS
jgi:hypothetical protein